MAVTTTWYGVPLANIFKGTANSVWDWDTDTIKVALLTSTYSFDNTKKDTHDFYNDLTNELSTGAGYTSGGATITTPTSTYNTATDTVQIDCDDVSWASSTITARYAVFYKSTGTASTSPLICIVDFGADVSTTSGTFTITIDATGVIKAVIS